MAEGQQQQQQQQPLRIFAIGDSLTAGFYNHGHAYHSYAIHLGNLFKSAHIPVHIDQRGVPGEHVVPAMVNRLRNFLKHPKYDWVIILGGTNDIGPGLAAEKIFKEGLQPMYEMCLKNTEHKMKLVVMTVMEVWCDALTSVKDKNRQALNTMIRDYATQSNDRDRICLVDLDKKIPFHGISNSERKRLWDDGVHLTPAGYDHMATLVFDAMHSKL